MPPLPSNRDTICALASARGRAGVAIVRLSGPDALAIGWRRFSPRRPLAAPPPRQMLLGAALDAAGQPLDDALLVYFPAGYAGEPTVEFHVHGSPAVVEALLTALAETGARPALPGEFTRRAFLAGRLDLAQAEAVADLIEAKSLAAARAAYRRLTGALSEKVGALRGLLAQAMAHFEAEIDFPDDDLGELDRRAAVALLDQALAGAAALLAGGQRARLLAQGAAVAIAGRPNAGKSSLFNRLAGARRAIVHETAGTTRDAIETEIELAGAPLRLIDTAGLRGPENEVERQGVELAREAIAGADWILYVIDGAVGVTPADRQTVGEFDAARVIPVWNKADLRPPDAAFAEWRGVAVSAKDGTGVDELRGRLSAALGLDAAAGEALLAAVRHRQLVQTAQACLTEARRLALAGAGAELAAVELREAADALGEIIGETTAEQVLDAVFSRFCIGK
jgi:tRNA modification GTPase